MKLEGEIISFQGYDYISPKGYEKFAFHYDINSKKYLVATREDLNNKTEYFIDEIIYSEVPLETWTANYVCVRIGEYYYLMDCQGNCYHKNSEPYSICRNLFVAYDNSFFINANFEKIETSVEILEVEKYIFATEKDWLLDIWGNYELQLYKYKTENLHKWFLSGRDETSDAIISKEFEEADMPAYSFKVRLDLVGEKSQTYKIRGGDSYYSIHFDAVVNFQKMGQIEIVEHDGKTYHFDSNGKIEEIRCPGIKHLLSQNMIIYRVRDFIYAKDLDGISIIMRQEVLREIYQNVLLESILSTIENLKK